VLPGSLKPQSMSDVDGCMHVSKDYEFPVIVEESLSSNEETSPSTRCSVPVKQVELNLDPIRLDNFTELEIIDDFVDSCSEDESPFEPSHIVYDAVTKPPKRSSKMVSPVTVRRSSRLNKALFA